MPFASFNSTNPRTNPWNFHKKILRIGDFEKWPFLSRPFCFCFQKKNFVLFFSNEENLGFHMRYHFFRNFDDYPGFKPKITPPNISAGSVSDLWITQLCCKALLWLFLNLLVTLSLTTYLNGSKYKVKLQESITRSHGVLLLLICTLKIDFEGVTQDLYRLYIFLG